MPPDETCELGISKGVIILTWLTGLVSGNGGRQQFRGVPIAGAGARAISSFAAGFVEATDPYPFLLIMSIHLRSYDFNPILLQGVRGYPGIRARINQRTFQYASGLIAEVLNQQIKKARIPPITQCIPQVQGCAQIYNLYVSRYRCPQRVVLYPAPPNRIILQVDNVDIGVTGNLGGQVVVLLPIPLSGIIQLNIQQVGITVELSLERGPSGPYVRILSCNVQIGYADAYIENGGLIGYIINTQFRQRISSQVKEMIPSRICGQLPTIVNQMLNTRLAALPQLIAVSQLLSMFASALPFGGLGQTPSPQFDAKNEKPKGE
uniref:BPI1 domain-containing protein n=1 Tax=Angiostrongylus cantonensis TaxID=6313 RepID=A0A0K0DHG7_ANGCA